MFNIFIIIQNINVVNLLFNRCCIWWLTSHKYLVNAPISNRSIVHISLKIA